MKTTTFGRIEVKQVEGGNILEVFSPGQGTVQLSLTPDELMMFLVEVGNGLAEARFQELLERQKRDLEREKRK